MNAERLRTKSDNVLMKSDAGKCEVGTVVYELGRAEHELGDR